MEYINKMEEYPLTHDKVCNELNENNKIKYQIKCMSMIMKRNTQKK